MCEVLDPISARDRRTYGGLDRDRCNSYVAARTRARSGISGTNLISASPSREPPLGPVARRPSQQRAERDSTIPYLTCALSKVECT